MTTQHHKAVGFPLAFQIYSYGSIDWNNPPLTSEYPYLSKELLEVLFYFCLDHDLLKFILLPPTKILVSPFLSHKAEPKIFTNIAVIKKRLNYFISRILNKESAIIGVTGDPVTFLKLFRNIYWAINGISIEEANSKINDLFVDVMLKATTKLSCDNLLFISRDCDPIYLIQASNWQ